MKILIVYGSIEGQTAKIAKFAANCVQELGHEVELVDSSAKTAVASFDGVDRIIAAASVHERRHPKPFEVFLSAHKTDMNARPALFLSVSLNAAFEDVRPEAEEYVVEMNMRTGFTPQSYMLVAGAVRSGAYDYYESQVVRHVLLTDMKYDANQTELEFTDWEAVKAGVEAFLKAG